jgi:uncharacterized protein YcfL
MRHFIIFFLLVSVIGCASNQEKANVFNESDYTLVKTESFKNIIAKKIFAYKSDTTRKLTIEYWDNGNVMQKEFSYKGLLEGKKETYTIDGELFGSTSYHEGIQIDTK